MNEQFINKYRIYLDEKKQQTTYKIDYITKYIEKWLFVVANVTANKNINFIDCMCNAGIYQDGDYCSSIRTLMLFNNFAEEHKDKEFNILLNDYDGNRVNIVSEIIKTIGMKPNVHCYICNKDVNAYLLQDTYFKPFFNCYPNRSANLLFVDPYNFCSVKISVLENFLSNNYCELLYNVFTSDFIRNSDKAKMQKYCQEEKINVNSKEDMLNLLTSRLKVGHIRFSFSYSFRTKNKNEIYQIMFFTPSQKGLEKLKEALWDTFNGKEFHQNKENDDSGIAQLSMFTAEQETQFTIDSYSLEAMNLLCENFKGRTVLYTEFELFLIEKTLLKDTQIISNVIIPLINNGKITKLNKVNRKTNYKKDYYQVN